MKHFRHQSPTPQQQTTRAMRLGLLIAIMGIVALGTTFTTDMIDRGWRLIITVATVAASIAWVRPNKE